MISTNRGYKSLQQIIVFYIHEYTYNTYSIVSCNSKIPCLVCLQVEANWLHKPTYMATRMTSGLCIVNGLPSIVVPLYRIVHGVRDFRSSMR
jgi:hypothetical protein